MVGDRAWPALVVAGAGAGVVAVSVAAGVVLGTDISEALWVLVPVGLLGGGIVTVVALAVFVARLMDNSPGPS